MINRPGKIKIGISSCLLGNSVRYDGGHRRDANIINVLGQYFDFLPFCPEVETGMGVPRNPIHLVRRGNEILALEIDNHANDFTRQLEKYCLVNKQKISELSGFVLKARSPSCGMQNVRVYHEDMTERTGVGIFACALKKQFPLLPMEDEGSLDDQVFLNEFIGRILDYHQRESNSDCE